MLQIKKVSVFFQPSDLIPLSLPSAGLIQDINLPALTQLLDKLQRPAMVQGKEKILVTRLVGDYIQKNQAIAFISIDESDQVGEIQELLQRAFIIRKPTQDTGELPNLLEQVKSRTAFAIKEHDDELFERMLDVYVFLFELYVDLPLPPSAETIPDLFRGWNAIANAVLHLNEIAKTASSEGDEKYISRLAYILNRIATTIISSADEHLSESFADVMRLYITMYYASYNVGNKTGISQSFYYLTGSLVDRTWMQKLHSVRDNPQAAQNLRTALEIILRTLAELLRDMVRNQDVENFKQLIQEMKPSELLAYFSIGLPDSSERFRLQDELRNATPEHRAPIEKRLEVLNLVEGIPRELGGFLYRVDLRHRELCG